VGLLLIRQVTFKGINQYTKLRVFLYQRRKLLSRRVIRQLISFVSTCETGFSNYAATKTKQRNTLNDAPDLRIQLSRIKSDIKRIFEEKNGNTKTLLGLVNGNMWYIAFYASVFEYMKCDF
jgi:hypothetical protein